MQRLLIQNSLLMGGKVRKIAFFIPHFNAGGIERVFVTYANALAADYDVTMLVIRDEGVLKNELASSVRVVKLGASRMRYAMPALVWMFLRFRFDYVITGMFETTFPAVLASFVLLKRVKVVASKHDYKMQHEGLLLWALRHSHRLFAVSEGVKQLLVKKGLPAENIAVIHNPVLIDVIRQKAQQKVMELPEKYIVFVGRFNNIKNIPYLLKGFSLFRKQHEDYRLVLVGDGPARKQIEFVIARLGISDYVTMTGALQNPYPYILNSQMLALTSFSEGLPTVILEALALGKTVVSTPNYGAKELIDHGVTGFLTNDFCDSSEFAEMLERALEPVSQEQCRMRASQFGLHESLVNIHNLLK